MTVSMQVSKRIYAGNGVTRRWEVDFPLASPQDVRVYVTSPAGAETELAEDFELNAAGTELEYPTLSSGKPPLAEGWSLTLERHTPLTQEIDLLRQGELDAEVLESGYDKLTLMVQELNEKVSRSIKYPVSTVVNDLETDGFLRNILSIKQEALNASSSAVASAQDAQASASTAQQTAQSALAAIASSKVSAQNDIAASGAAVENTLQTYLSAAQNEAETARYYAERSIGKTVGEVYYSQSAAETDNPGALPLFTGETIASASTLYPDFYAWLQNHSGLTCTAAEYEAALSTYGECPKYVLADGNLRLPLLKNYIKCANETDGITQKKAGLPNITGYTGLGESENLQDGAFGKRTESKRYTNGTGYSASANAIYLDASRSSSVYGQSDTVTPAHTTLYPWVCAYNAAVAASTAQTAQFQSALSGKVDVPFGKTQADVDFVVESYSDENGNWYRQYKSGWLEQGGFGKGTITFLKPYSAPPNVITGSANKTGDGLPARGNEVTATGFYLYGGNQDTLSAYWEAKGQGE
ncbi:MAG: hypothetical protein Q4P84_03740 [Elusimicrobiales bacterium]|nr:hypothetical protein [Elusimicrobiales bacterium]